ncbi:MAG: molybdopterin synthase sulfur carrier subunit [Flavobacteriales bacterium]|jgi:molybdopterin synthase sulfur carrier subunit
MNANIKISILYFANLSEDFGLNQETLEVEAGTFTIAMLKELLAKRGALWSEKLFAASTRCALNQGMANDADTIEDGAEIAFFPPVTGG